MGIQAPSFELKLPAGPLPANSGLVTSSYNADSVTVTCGDREVPTTTVWSGRLADYNGAMTLAMVRPTSGDWPVGTLRVVARGWQRVLKETDVTVGPAIEGSPPACSYVSAPMQIFSPSHPGGGTQPPTAGVAYAGLVDKHGPVVSLALEYRIKGDAHLYKQQDIGNSQWGRGAILVGDRFEELVRLTITNVLGRSLEILPPFPRGTPPEGPVGVRV